MSEPLVRATGLTKRFGDFTAVDGVDFDVTPGEVFGFLGPNGAGKSSTMKMIGAVSPVTEGSLTVFGLDPAGRRCRDPGAAGIGAPGEPARHRADRF